MCTTAECKAAHLSAGLRVSRLAGDLTIDRLKATLYKFDDPMAFCEKGSLDSRTSGATILDFRN